MMAWHACDSVSGTSDRHLRCLKRGVIGSSKAAIFGAPGSQHLLDRGLQAGGFRSVPEDWSCVDGRYCFEVVSSSSFSEPFSGIVLAFITELRK